MMPRILPLAALMTLCFSLVACGDKKPAETAEPAQKTDPNLVIADEAMRTRLKIGVVELAPFSEVLRVPGLIDFDQQRMARLSAPVTGRLTDISATVGQAVKPGDVLARLHSTELGHAQLAFLDRKSVV